MAFLDCRWGFCYIVVMDRQLIKTALGWGVGLWLIGYLLGIVFFMFLPPNVIGWVIMPIGAVITLWVLFKKVKLVSFKSYFFLAVVWTVVAIAFDYFFLVKLFKPVDGYYKLDVYIYYLLTFLLPLIVGWKKVLIKPGKTY